MAKVTTTDGEYLDAAVTITQAIGIAEENGLTSFYYVAHNPILGASPATRKFWYRKDPNTEFWYLEMGPMLAIDSEE